MIKWPNGKVPNGKFGAGLLDVIATLKELFMGRLQEEFLVRVEMFADQVLDIAETLAREHRPPRIVSQIIGAGTSVGANIFEADEAMSRPDFCKCLNIAIKELNETRFWMRLLTRRGWIAPELLHALQQECIELKRIMGTILTRSRNGSKSAS